MPAARYARLAAFSKALVVRVRSPVTNDVAQSAAELGNSWTMSATLAEVVSLLEKLPPNPRIVASGNAAIPFELLRIADQTLPGFTLNMLAAHAGLPMREGITHETSFVGPGMRKSLRLSYVPARLSMVRQSLTPHLNQCHRRRDRGLQGTRWHDHRPG